MTHQTDEKLDEMARDLCHTGELSMPYRCEIADAITALRAQLADAQADLTFMTEDRNKWQDSATDRYFRIEESNARAERAEADRAFTLSDGQRMLRKRDILTVCDTPGLCFEHDDSVARCGPCAAKLAERDGVALNQYTASNPEAMRLRRDLNRAKAALAAQIEVGARIAGDYVAMRERQISVEQAKASHHIDVPQIMRWQAGKVQSREIATSTRNQPHDRTALDRIIADTRAKALTWAADQLNDSHILSAAVRTGYETPEDRIAALDRVAAAAVKSFCGARDETEALKMALRHAEDRIEAARSRIVMVRTQIEDRAAQGTAIRSA